MSTRTIRLEGRYEEVIAMVNPDSSETSDDQLLDLGWARHQLGEYEVGIQIMRGLAERYTANSEIGESARRCLIHAYSQLGYDTEARTLLEEIPYSPARENVRAGEILADARKGQPIPMLEVRQMLSMALWRVPVDPADRTNAHIISNLVFAMHNRREQEDVLPHVFKLPGFMEIALGIYESANSAPNHIAGCMLRGMHIFLANNWLKGVETLASQAIPLWEGLCEANPDNQGYADRLQEVRDLLTEVHRRMASA